MALGEALGTASSGGHCDLRDPTIDQLCTARAGVGASAQYDDPGPFQRSRPADEVQPDSDNGAALGGQTGVCGHLAGRLEGFLHDVPDEITDRGLLARLGQGTFELPGNLPLPGDHGFQATGNAEQSPHGFIVTQQFAVGGQSRRIQLRHERSQLLVGQIRLHDDGNSVAGGQDHGPPHLRRIRQPDSKAFD